MSPVRPSSWLESISTKHSRRATGCKSAHAATSSHSTRSTPPSKRTSNNGSNGSATFDSFLPLCGHVHGLLTRNAGTLVHAADGKLAVLAMIVDRLVASILRDESRTSETVTREGTLRGSRYLSGAPRSTHTTVTLGRLGGRRMTSTQAWATTTQVASS